MGPRRNEGGARCPQCGFVFFAAQHGARGADVGPSVVHELAEHLAARHGAPRWVAARSAREAYCRDWLVQLRAARRVPLGRPVLWARCPACRTEVAIEPDVPRDTQAALRTLRDHLAREHRRAPLQSHRDALKAVVGAGARVAP